MTGVGGPELRMGRELAGAAFIVLLTGCAAACGGWLAGCTAGRFGSDARPGGGGGLLAEGAAEATGAAARM
jgi:hypothetical protein